MHFSWTSFLTKFFQSWNQKLHPFVIKFAQKSNPHWVWLSIMSGIYKRNGIILSNQQGSDNHQDRFFKFGTLVELHDRHANVFMSPTMVTLYIFWKLVNIHIWTMIIKSTELVLFVVKWKMTLFLVLFTFLYENI